MVLMMVMLVPYMAHGQESAARSTFTDIQGHWAEETIIKWSDMGLVNGQSADRFNPNASITRSELAALINNVADVSGEAAISFTDVASNKWYYIEVAKAVSAGYMQGYADGTFKPEAPITRQELAVLITRLLGITEQEPDATYTDVANAPAWSKGAIGAMIETGIMSGKSAGQFSPLTSTTRAEAVVILDRIASRVVTPDVPALTVKYDEAGTYGGEAQETVEGAIIISAADVILQNTTVAGDLTITADVGEGNVTLRGVTVRGRTLIQGGGENSIHFEGSSLGQVEVNKAGGKVRVTFDETSEAELVRLQSPTKVEAAEGSEVGEVELGQQLPAGAEIVLDGSFGRVVVGSQQSNITADNGTIATFQVKKEAKGSKVQLGKNSKVTQLTLDSGASVTGEGSIDKAAINAEGSTLSKKPGNVVVADGVQASVGGSTVGGTTTPPPAVGGGGGGGIVPNPGNPGGGGPGPNPNPGNPDPEHNIVGTVYDEKGVVLHGTYWMFLKDNIGDSTFTVTVKDGKFSAFAPPGEYMIYDLTNIETWETERMALSVTIKSIGKTEFNVRIPEKHISVHLAIPDDAPDQFNLFIWDKEGQRGYEYTVTKQSSNPILMYLKPGEYEFQYSDGKQSLLIGEESFTNTPTDLFLNVPSLTVGSVNINNSSLNEGSFRYTDGRGRNYNVPVIDGKFSVRLIDGQYVRNTITYKFQLKNGEYINHTENVREFKVTNGMLEHPLSFNLKGVNTVGSVLDEQGNRIESGFLWVKKSSIGVGSSYMLPINNGYFAGHLMSGEYAILEYSSLIISERTGLPVSLNIPDGEGLNEFHLEMRAANVRGEFLNSDLTPVAQAKIEVRTGGGLSSRVYNANVTNGSFQLYLPDGEYQISGQSSSGSTIPKRFTVSNGKADFISLILNKPNYSGKLGYSGNGTIHVSQLGTFIPFTVPINNGEYNVYLPDGIYNILSLRVNNVSINSGKRLVVENGVVLTDPIDGVEQPSLIKVYIQFEDNNANDNYKISFTTTEMFGDLSIRVNEGLNEFYFFPGDYFITGYGKVDESFVHSLNITFSVPGENEFTITIPEN